jgi:hypothetical protein
MHQPGYIQGGQEVGRGYLLLGIHYRRIREHSTHVGFYDLFILRYSVCTRKPILYCFGLAVSALLRWMHFLGIYVAKFIVPDQGDKVNSGIELSCRPARLHTVGWRTSSQINSPSMGGKVISGIGLPYRPASYIGWWTSS